MNPNDNQVEKIIEYLQGKIEGLKGKLKAYESPIMQDMAKNSTHLQMDYIRISAELQANEDNLLAIQKFASSSSPKQPALTKTKGRNNEQGEK